MSEILAPAGGKEQLIAAVRCGADAVYLGAKGFNARRNAQNFDELELKESVSYCHARGVMVHVAVNTLITDNEIPQLIEELKQIAKSGADAVIVQDLLTAKLVRETIPDIKMHASTQMTIHNLAGVKELKKLGFSRVVLARELSLDEIKYIADNTDIELECFIHGALCMCVSGGCYLSSVLGGRSGNRGLCAQPCRLDFHSGDRGYALSLKDMSYIPYIDELAKVGITSFKIEGRMKRPEYVAAAVSACRKSLSGNTPDMDTLQSVFSRGGFTDGYLNGKRDLSMFGYRSHEDVISTEKVLKPLSLLYKDEYQRVPVKMSLDLFRGALAVLTVSDGIDTITEVGPLCQKAEKTPTDEFLAYKNLSKCGGTPFILDKFQFNSDNSSMLSAKDINSVRRNALEKLLNIRGEIKPLRFLPFTLPSLKEHITNPTPKVRIRVEKITQVSEKIKAQFFIIPVSELISHTDYLKENADKIIAELPFLLWPNDEKAIIKDLTVLKAYGLTHAQVDNIGALHIAKELGLIIHGGSGLNIINSVSLNEYSSLGLNDATVSFEISMAKLKALKGDINRGIIVAGNLPLMHCRACPIQSDKGCKNCKGYGHITDRRGTDFTVICHNKKYISLHNPIPLWLADKEVMGADFVTLYFTNETPAKALSLYEDYIAHKPMNGEKTNGLYFRELK